jgi:O-acetyl-ADP-ribose deacetylase (regulator of RNase III)
MGQDLETDAELIRRTTRSCLALADELGCRSVVLPAFGTGVGGFRLEECARLMVDEARRFEPRSLDRVIFSVYGGVAYDVFSSEVSSPLPDGS